MSTAHAYFFRGIDYATASALVTATHQLFSERDNNGFKWNALVLVMSSGGGDIISAFGLYNELKGLGVPLTTHNAGAVDSSAILPFLAGSKRTASAASAFFFHQLHWTFASKDQLTRGTISDASAWLTRYEDMMAATVASRTKLEKAKVLDMMRIGTSMGSEEAKAVGLIDNIVELATPQTARTWIV